MPYIIHIEGNIEGNLSALALYWYARNDLGTGIAHAISHSCDELEFSDTHASAVKYTSNVDAPPDTYQTDKADLWSFVEYGTYPFEPSFWFPTGIVPSIRQQPEGIDPGDIVEAYSTGYSDETHWLQAVVDQRRLWQVFTDVFNALPSSDGLELRLLDHWEKYGVTANPCLVQALIAQQSCTVQRFSYRHG